MEPRRIQVDLRGKIALVTGGAGGIGSAVSRALAENGARVAVNYLTSAQPARELVARLKNQGRTALAIKADVTIEAAIERLFDTIEAQWGGPVDILVNNAGTQIALLSVEAMTAAVWSKALSLILTSKMMCARRAISGMKKKGWGRIINVASISACSGGGPGGVSYASAMGAVATFTKGLAKELGPTGITVNAVAPGVILTAIHEKFSTPASLRNLKKMTPLGRHGQPADVAGAVLFLASDSAAFITGETISINGGLRMD